MTSKFIDLWHKSHLNGSSTEQFFLIQKLYSQPDRYYHNLNHIKSCLEEFDQVKEFRSDSAVVVIDIQSILEFFNAPENLKTLRISLYSPIYSILALVLDCE